MGVPVGEKMGERERKAEEWRIIYVFNGNISDIEFVFLTEKVDSKKKPHPCTGQDVKITVSFLWES